MPLPRRLVVAWRDRAHARLLRRALIASVAVHLAGVAPFVVGPMLSAPVAPKATPIFAQVELIQQDTPTVGDAPEASAQTPPPAPASQPTNPVQPTPPDEQSEVAAAAQPAPPRPPMPAPQDQPAPQAAPVQSATNEEPAIRLGDNGETGTGLVSGSAVIPAGVNTTVRNRLPTYPAAAARRGEEGVVVLLVQISLDGTANAVDVAQSSGYETLDETARAAVSHWRFRPAVENGAPIASAMEVQVHFAIRRKAP